MSLNVSVIVALTNPAAAQAKKATTDIPIVVIGHDVVGTGLVESLARPGANVTGIESLGPELDAKRVEIVREVLPGATRLALLYNPRDSGMQSHLRWTTAAADRFSIATQPYPVSSREALTAALGSVARGRLDALLVFTDALTFTARKEIAQFAATNGLPAVFEFSEFLEDGGLVSYGPDLSDLWRRAAHYVDKVLKGAKPADLPVEQPTKLRLVINARSARALGVTIPQFLLLRADEVIQ